MTPIEQLPIREYVGTRDVDITTIADDCRWRRILNPYTGREYRVLRLRNN